MANTFDISEFKTRLNDGTYKGAAGARRAVGRAPWTAKDKALAETLISSKFEAGEKAPKGKPATKLEAAPKKGVKSAAKALKPAVAKSTAPGKMKKAGKMKTSGKAASAPKKSAKLSIKSDVNNVIGHVPARPRGREDTYTLSVCHQSMELLERVASHGVEVSKDSFNAINDVVCSVVNNLKTRAVSSILPSNSVSEVADDSADDSEEYPLHDDEDSIDMDALSLRARPPQ